MKCVILAGGSGTRISDEPGTSPKSMIQIGDNPIIWHLMKLYSHYGINDFIIGLGDKGYEIKEYFLNYYLHNADVTFDMADNKVEFHAKRSEPWSVTLVDTGHQTATGGRLRRIRPYVSDATFCMTYGDGLSNVDINAQLAFHRQAGRSATVTCVRPPSRFGRINASEGQAEGFEDQPISEGGLINGGFFVLDPEALDGCTSDHTIWEEEPLQQLAAAGQLSTWVHEDFWQQMDTLRDKHTLENLWAKGVAPWKIW